MVMVLRGWELILGYHSSMPRNLCGLQVGRQSWTHSRFRTKRCAPELFSHFVSMHIASISCSFWVGLEAQSPANRSLRTAKFWLGGQTKKKSTRTPSASARVPGGPPHLEVRLARAWRPRTSCPRPMSVGRAFFKQLWQVPGGLRS